jgi:hypothetical protein
MRALLRNRAALLGTAQLRRLFADQELVPAVPSASATCSHFGARPRPDHVSPWGDRYFAATGARSAF